MLTLELLSARIVQLVTSARDQELTAVMLVMPEPSLMLDRGGANLVMPEPSLETKLQSVLTAHPVQSHLNVALRPVPHALLVPTTTPQPVLTAASVLKVPTVMLELPLALLALQGLKVIRQDVLPVQPAPQDHSLPPGLLSVLLVPQVVWHLRKGQQCAPCVLLELT